MHFLSVCLTEKDHSILYICFFYALNLYVFQIRCQDLVKEQPKLTEQLLKNLTSKGVWLYYRSNDNKIQLNLSILAITRNDL